MARLHERMPVILEPEEWPVWLGELCTCFVKDDQTYLSPFCRGALSTTASFKTPIWLAGSDANETNLHSEVVAPINIYKRLHRET